MHKNPHDAYDSVCIRLTLSQLISIKIKQVAVRKRSEAFSFGGRGGGVLGIFTWFALNSKMYRAS